jgi:hypothetical protein
MYAIGVAVVVAQMFEAVFVMVARTALKHPDAVQMEDIAPFSAKAYKQPVTALLRELTDHEQIDCGLADRIFDLIEDRNLLVHRIFLARAASDSVENIFDDALLHLCRKVYSEAGALSADLLDMFFAYSERFQEAAQFLAENRDTFDSFAKYIRTVRARVFA